MKLNVQKLERLCYRMVEIS